MECIEVFWRDELISQMYVDYKTQTIKVTNYTDDILKLPFGRKEYEPTWSDYRYLLSIRVFPPERRNCKAILKAYGLTTYDPDSICRKSHAVMFDDYMWFRYPGEQVTFNDVKVRD